MCSGGSSSGNSAQQAALQQEQITEAAQASAAQLAEQQREFDVQTAQANATLANTQAQEAQQQAQADAQAQLTQEWQTGQAAEIAAGTNTVNNAFASFTPAYYAAYTKANEDYYDPQIDKQYDAASNQTDFGLARTGNLDSQTAANQFSDLADQKGVAEANVNNAAVAATSTLQSNVAAAKSNLLAAATSADTIGSPITPGSADAISADFNNTSTALKNIGTTAGDTVTTLQATPAYSSLGTLFGGVATTAGAAVQGSNNYNNLAAYNTGSGVGAANPSSGSSGTVS